MYRINPEETAQQINTNLYISKYTYSIAVLNIEIAE